MHLTGGAALLAILVVLLIPVLVVVGIILVIIRLFRKGSPPSPNQIGTSDRVSTDHPVLKQVGAVATEIVADEIITGGRGFSIGGPMYGNPYYRGYGVNIITGKPAAILGFLFGLLFIGIGWFILQISSKPAADTATTTGQVLSTVQNFTGSFNHQSIQYLTTIGYDAPNGVHEQFSYQTGTLYYRGDTVKVAYNPTDPSIGAYNESDTRTQYFVWIFIIAGILVSVMGVITFFRRSSSQQTPPPGNNTV